ncbi:uncharacterized protein LOC121443600 isoform X2 [Microtus oregoni]|uniref:uncharacterized protein LOC121443600 isoform X2 n=1 Tax=Microtus oregoni TaxID=111838 RepID=UPI001BB1930E|nr:uncharacterized protein LOC121443600 isoform X2 [Microtus oregoni]
MGPAHTESMRCPSFCQVSAHTSAVDAAAREEFEWVLSSMCQKLKSQKYNGSYFDRGAEASERLFTPEDWFSCQGPFDLESCLSKHSINPYGNRESWILFSTWNLDHIWRAMQIWTPPRIKKASGGLVWTLHEKEYPGSDLQTPWEIDTGRTTARDTDTAVTSDAAVTAAAAAALAGARLRRRRSVGSGALTHEEPEGSATSLFILSFHEQTRVQKNAFQSQRG